ncbi:PREDICTED: probable basic-leucine zipper transcription factor R [Trachymyrmex cornetzi]|uniref:Uncharacterized protein n=1 Tax=Trachymyrmex cornetzi TaxID=471704 RepID=A0A151JCK1_9HYME|nr:PREDICTED: probable basic-leucine zipper transcription factor R [Trachymyrmex cornetzi]KYN23248.1 hypothetical protein ALC57_04337 [Trachymyrmex cornetzi]
MTPSPTPSPSPTPPTPPTPRQAQNEDQEQEHQQQEQRRRQHEVDNFNYIDLRAENSQQFRNLAILWREATFAIRPPPEGSDIAQWLENAFREI